MLLLQVHPAFFKADIWTFHNRKSTGVNINNFPFLLKTWQWASMLNTRTWNWSCWMIFIIKLIIYMSSHGMSKCLLCKKADCDVFDPKTTFLIKALNRALVAPHFPYLWNKLSEIFCCEFGFMTNLTLEWRDKTKKEIAILLLEFPFPHIEQKGMNKSKKEQNSSPVCSHECLCASEDT